MTAEIVVIQHLSRIFGKTVALADVSLCVRPGVVYGLVGENGAGKTTLIKHLLGLYRAECGSVRVFGLDPVVASVPVLSRVGYLSEERDLPDWMRLGELIRYLSAFYPGWDDAFARQLLEMFELLATQKVRTLSRGQRARAALLVALAHRPDLLLLDEPSSGLDPGARQDILAAVVRTVADEGRTVIFSSHLLHEVQRVADHIAFLHRGQLVVDEPLDALLSRHHLVTLRFTTAVSDPPSLAGALTWTGEGTEWTCLCNGELAGLRRAAESAGATIVEERAPSLEEIFLARIRRPVLGGVSP